MTPKRKSGVGKYFKSKKGMSNAVRTDLIEKSLKMLVTGNEGIWCLPLWS